MDRRESAGKGHASKGFSFSARPPKLPAPDESSLGAEEAQLWEVEYAFINDGKPFGEVRVVVDSAILVQEIRSDLRIGGIIVLVVLIVSAFLATMVSRIRFLRTAESS